MIEYGVCFQTTKWLIIIICIPKNNGYCITNSMTGSIGTPNIKVLNLHFGGKKVGLSQQFGTRSWISKQSLQYTSLVMSRQKVRFSPTEIQCKFFYSLIFYNFFLCRPLLYYSISLSLLEEFLPSMILI